MSRMDGGPEGRVDRPDAADTGAATADEVICTRTEEEVLAFVGGELQDDDELSMAVHMGECAECCEQAAEFAVLRNELAACCTGEEVRWHRFTSPFGSLYVAATELGLVRVSWQQRGDDAFVAALEARFPCSPVVRDPEALAEAERQLEEYFAGERSRFELPIDFGAMSPFDRKVLETAFRTIGFGQVVPYSELARRIGAPRAARAVGGALGRNPVAIVVPCHRVVRSDGGLGGYGGGVEWKEKLLALEGRDDLLRAS